MLGTATPARAETFTFTPSSAPPGASVGVNVSGDWVDTWFPEPGSTFVLADGGVYSFVTDCVKKTNLLNQTRWIHCEFTVPSQAAPGPWTLRLFVSFDTGSRTSPPADFNIESPPPASTTTPPTTAPQPTTTPPTTAPQPTTSAPTGDTATTEGIDSTSTTQTIQKQSTTTDSVLAIAAGSDETDGAGGPSWLTVGLVGALAVALTVIAMQELQRRRDQS
jgi:hypothetical protein